MIPTASLPFSTPAPKLGRLLVVDDEVELMTALREMLTRQGYEVAGYTSGREALEALRQGEFDLLLTDLMMPGLDGIALLRAGLEIDPHLVGVIMTGQGTVQTAVEAMKTGVFDYVLKPFKLSAVLPILSCALDVRRLRVENVQLRETVAIYELSQAIAFTADEASTMLPTPEGQELYVAAVRGEQRAHLLGARVPFEQSIAGWVARQRQPVNLQGEVRDARFAPIHPPDDRPLLEAANRGEMLSGAPLTLRWVRKDGSLVWTEQQNVPIYDEAGRLVAVEGIARDVTERKRAEEALRRAEAKYRTLVEQLPAITYIAALDETSSNLYVSPQIALLGYSVEEWMADPAIWANTLHSDDRERVLAEIHYSQTTGEPFSSEYRMPTRDGRTLWFHDRAVLVRNEEGQPLFLQGVMLDVTDRKQTEAAVRESEARLRTILENMPVMLDALDEAGNTIVWNRECERVTGYSAEEIFSHPNVAELLYPDPTYRKHMQAALAASGDDYRDWEWATTCKDGSVKIIAWSNISGRFPVPGWARWGVGVDLTERKRAEAAVAASEAELRALFAAMTDVILVLDAEGRYLKIAPTNPALLYKPPAELIGRTLHEVFPTAQADTFLHGIRQALAAGQPIKLEYSLTIDSAQIWFDATVSPMSEKTAFWVARDITERRQRERELEAKAAVSTALRTAPTRADMLPVILEQVLTLLKAEGAALDMRDPATGETVVELGAGAWVELTSMRLPAGEGVTAQVLATGRPYMSDDAQTDPRYFRPALSSATRAVACVPLIAQSQAVGALWVGRSAPFSEGEVHRLSAIADIAANAVQRATLHEETQRNLERLAALRAIDLAISSSLDLRLTLNILLEQVIAQLRVNAADVLLVNPHTHTLDYAAGRGFRSAAIEHSHPRLGQGYAGRAAFERRTISLPDLSNEEPDLARANLLVSEDFQAYFGVPLIAKGQVEGVLEIFHRVPLRPDRDWLEFLEALAGQAAIAIDNAELFSQLQRSNLHLTLAYDATIAGWSRALDLRDKETEGHTQRVTEMTLRLAQAMGINDEELVHVRRGALLHDIGKMGVPDGILLKPGPLTEDEWVVMRKHPTYAYDMLSPIVYLRPALDIPYCHHEKWDGTGYPRGLRGGRIPLAARIFAVADVWDALRSDRPYRPGWPEEKVREHIRSLAGTHFDPAVVEVFLRLADEIRSDTSRPGTEA